MSCMTNYCRRAQKQYHAAIRTFVPMEEIPSLLPPLITKVMDWIEKNNIAPEGPTFFEYKSKDKNNLLKAAVGVPVKEEIKDKDFIRGGSCPADKYARLTHFGH
jgi:hypothetical protein